MSTTTIGQEILPIQTLDFSVPYDPTNAPPQFKVASSSINSVEYNASYDTCTINPGITIDLEFDITIPIKVMFKWSICSVDASGVYSGPFSITINGFIIASDITPKSLGFEIYAYEIPAFYLTAGLNTISITAKLGSLPAIWFNLASVEQIDKNIQGINFQSNPPTSTKGLTFEGANGDAGYDPISKSMVIKPGGSVNIQLIPSITILAGGFLVGIGLINAVNPGLQLQGNGDIIPQAPNQPEGGDIMFGPIEAPVNNHPQDFEVVNMGNENLEMVNAEAIPVGNPIVVPNYQIVNAQQVLNAILFGLGYAINGEPWEINQLLPNSQSDNPIYLLNQLFQNHTSPVDPSNPPSPYWTCSELAGGMSNSLIENAVNPSEFNENVKLDNNWNAIAFSELFTEGSFSVIHINTISPFAHAFTIYVTDGSAYLIQIWKDSIEVPLVNRLDVLEFSQLIIELTTNNWADSYQDLFGIRPQSLEPGDLPPNLGGLSISLIPFVNA